MYYFYFLSNLYFQFFNFLSYFPSPLSILSILFPSLTPSSDIGLGILQYWERIFPR